jgi:hypothetical protein
MCLPLAAAAAVAGAAVSAGGQIMQGLQAKAQGKYENQVAEINRGLAVDAYHDERTDDVQNRTDFWRKVSALKGQQIAAMAANGIDVGFGAGQKVQDDTAELAADDASRLYKQDAAKAKGHLIEASNFAQQGVAAKARGKVAFTSSLFGAASSILGGASQVAGMKAKMGTP